jgi:cell division protein FtsL
MKRYGLAILGLMVPGLLIVNVSQGYRYSELSNTVAALEKQQQDLLESNRDAIAQIAFEQSPARVEEKAGKSFGLFPADQAHVTRVLIQGRAGRQGP